MIVTIRGAAFSNSVEVARTAAERWRDRRDRT